MFVGLLKMMQVVKVLQLGGQLITPMGGVICQTKGTKVKLVVPYRGESPMIHSRTSIMYSTNVI